MLRLAGDYVDGGSEDITMTQTMTDNGTTTANSETALIRANDMGSIEPSTIGELRALAKDAADSRFFGAANMAQALMVMMAGRDLGLSYTQSLRAFHVIEGKPTLSADGMVAVCLGRKDVCEYFRVVEATEEKATVVAKRAGEPERSLTFTLAEAQRAGLVRDGSGWKKYPSRMLLARARAFLARELFPDLLMGLYDPDELRDGVEPTPARPVHVVAEVVTLQKNGTPAPVVAEPSSGAQAFAEQISKAASPDDLDLVAKAIADANLSESDKAYVRDLYVKRKKSLSSAKRAAAKVEREPGEEG